MKKIVDITSLLRNWRDERSWPLKDSLADESLLATLVDFLNDSTGFQSDDLARDRSEAMLFVGIVGANLDREDVRKLLCSFLSDPNERVSALKGLKEFENNSDILDQLFEYSCSRTFGLRYGAVEVLWNLRDPRIETFVLSRMGEIKDKHFLCELLRVLDLNGSEKSVGPLLDLVKVNRSTDVRREVTYILQSIACRVMLNPPTLKKVQRFLDNSPGIKEYKKPIQVGLEKMRETIEQRFNVGTTLVESDVGQYRFWARFDVYPYGVHFLTYGVTVLEKSRIFHGSIPVYPSFHFQIDSRYFGVPDLYESIQLDQVLADFDQRSRERMFKIRDAIEEFRTVSFESFAPNEETFFEALAMKKYLPIELPEYLNLIQLKESHPQFLLFLAESSRFALRPHERGWHEYKAYIRRHLPAKQNVNSHSP